MTLNGAIMQLVEMRESVFMPTLFKPALDKVIETISECEEPSTQPEIIRCKDCRHGVDYYHEGDCYCSNPKWGLKYFGGSWEFYCADAERRTDG